MRAFTDDFLVPYGHIRRKRSGYAVSIVKAALELIGRDAGPVRSPLADLTGDEKSMLAALIERMGPQG
jgi:5-dehydro-4-deoxyglucarate dehydratase